MATVLRTFPDSFTVALQAQLMTVLAWPAERVVVVDPDDVQETHTQAEQHLALWPGDARPDLPIFQGAGRVDTRLAWTFELRLWTRCDLDEPNSSLLWLTHQPVISPAQAGLGHLYWLRQVYNAMVCFYPEDASQNAYLVQPLYPVGQTKPRRDKKQREWGSSTTTWVAVFDDDLDQSVQ